MQKSSSNRVLHANDCPAVLLRLVIQRLRERADFGGGQSLSGTVRILSLCIVVQHEHRDPRAVARFGVFEHLLVAARIAERGERPAPNHQMDAFGLPGVSFGSFARNGLPLLSL